MISSPAIIPIRSICDASYCPGNGLFWLGRGYDVQVPRAVHLGSQVSVAAASGIAAAVLAGLPTGLSLLLLSCELNSSVFLELSLVGLQSEFLEVAVELQPMLTDKINIRGFFFSCCFLSHLFTCLLIAFYCSHCVEESNIWCHAYMDVTFFWFQPETAWLIDVFRWRTPVELDLVSKTHSKSQLSCELKKQIIILLCLLL